jgi:ABC-2 type transport system ATP-binding protein
VPVSVQIEDVSKRFRVYKDRPTSLKERIIRAGRHAHEDFWALSGISFDVHDGETLGLLGHNGSGKSTLLKCVAGTLRPTQGVIRTRGRLAALLELGAGFHGDLTGRENMYLNGSIIGFSRHDIDRLFDEIVAFSELEQFIDLPVKHYSSGMVARLGFSIAVHVDPDVLLVDEVLSVGDEAFQRKCMERIRGFQRDGRTIFLVTHAADLVRQLCDRAAVLDHGELVIVGEPNDAVRAFRETLISRGIPLPVEAAETPAERLSHVVRFTSTRLDIPAKRPFLYSGEPLRIAIGYEAARDVPDCIFSLTMHDQEGNLLLSTNTSLLGSDCAVAQGPGEVTFDLAAVPLLDGHYLISLGIEDSAGAQFDHRDQMDAFDVESVGRMAGRVAFDIQVTQQQLRDRAAIG